VHPVGGLDPIANETLAVSGEIPQLPNRGGRNETRANQSVREQVGQPLAVLDVGLPARHRLDVMGIGEDHTETALEEIEDRLPVHPGRFHGDKRAPRGGQPGVQSKDLGGRGAEGLHLGVFATTLLLAQAGDQRFLVDIDSAAVGMQHLHRVPLFLRGAPGSATG
jgi:hypothetical protein